MTQKITEYFNLAHLRVKVICLHAWCEETAMRNLVGITAKVSALTRVSNYPRITCDKQGNRVKFSSYPGLRANLFGVIIEVILRLRNHRHGGTSQHSGAQAQQFASSAVVGILRAL